MAVPVRRRSKGEIQAWDPFSEFSTLQDRMTRLFDELMPIRPGLRLLPSLRMEEWMPDVELYETETDVVAKAHVPGVEKKDLDVSIDEDSITIRGETRRSDESKTEDTYVSEINYGAFTRTVPLRSLVEPEKAEAHLTEGVLEVRIPKSPEVKAKTKKVEIE